MIRGIISTWKLSSACETSLPIPFPTISIRVPFIVPLIAPNTSRSKPG